jgi:hypothetical protein
VPEILAPGNQHHELALGKKPLKLRVFRLGQGVHVNPLLEGGLSRRRDLELFLKQIEINGVNLLLLSAGQAHRAWYPLDKCLNLFLRALNMMLGECRTAQTRPCYK